MYISSKSKKMIGARYGDIVKRRGVGVIDY
jgi:hypothetical protein